MMNRFKIAIFAIFIAFVMAACSEDGTDFQGSDNIIASFALEQQGGAKYYATITADSIIMSVSKNVSLAGAVPRITVSENATVSPDPASITDWEKNMEFTVKAFNGVFKTYKYAVVKRDLTFKGNVTLLTQADIEEFAASGISLVDGVLNIGTSVVKDTIKSLKSLSHLISVKYDLNIGSYFGGNSLEGLENLENAASVTIGTSRSYKMDNFTQISLPSLKKVNNDLSLNAPSAKIIDLPLLEFVGGTLSCNVDSIYTFKTPVLKTIGGEFRVWYSKNLKKLDMPLLKEMYALMFADNKILAEMNFPALTKMVDRFYIGSTGTLKTINAPLLETCGGLDISASSTESVNFGALRISTGRVYIYSLTGDINLSSLAEVISDAYLPTMTNANNLKLGALTKVEGALSINMSKDAEALMGFEKLGSVGKTLSINGNENDKITGFPGLNSLTNLERLEILGFTQLKDLKGLSSLSSVNILYMRNVGMANIDANTFPSSLKNVSKIEVWQMPLEKMDIRNLQVKNVVLEYMQQQEIKLIGDGSVLDELYIEACKKVECTGVDEVKSLRFWSNGAYGLDIVCTGVKKVSGNADLYHGASMLALPDLEVVTGQLKLSFPTKLHGLKSAGEILGNGSTWGNELPALETVNGNFTMPTGYGANSLEKIGMPKLTRVDGKFTIKGYNSTAAYQNTKLQNLDDLSALTKVGSIQIQNNQALTDYSGLKNVIGSLATGADWVTNNNGYNPTYQDMIDGKYTKP